MTILLRYKSGKERTIELDLPMKQRLLPLNYEGVRFIYYGIQDGRVFYTEYSNEKPLKSGA